MVFDNGIVVETGTAITKVLPPVSRFSPEGTHTLKKQVVVARMRELVDRFFGLG